MSEENFDFGADEVSLSEQMSDEEANAFDFNLDKDLKLEGLDDVTDTPSFDTIGGGTETEQSGEPQFDIDNLLDNIQFDDEDSRKQPFFETSEDVSSEQNNEPEFVAVADEQMTDEQTPSFMNEWAETPKDDGNGDWKAPQSFDEPVEEAPLETEEFSEVSDEFAEPEVTDEAEITDETEVTDEAEITDEAAFVSEEADTFNAEAESEPVVEEVTEENVWTEPEPVVSDIEEPVVDENDTEAVSEADFTEEAGGAETYFENDVTEAAVAEQVIATNPATPDVHDAGYAKWFSGAADNQYFEIGRQTAPYVIEGNDVCQAIHVNCSFDAYGWLVCFDNGMMMSLSDVREYQLRNGGLPDENGVIRYGSNEFPFSRISRIVIYQSVQYFSYGV